jgi:hypothetical protein
MPDKTPLTKEQFGITSEKMFNFALCMFDPASDTYDNGTKSMKAAKFNGNDNTLAVRASSLIRNDKIIAVKDALQADNREKADYSREKLLETMQGIVQNGAKDSDRIKAGSLIADCCGWKRENAPNPEREASRRIMTAQEKRLFLEFAHKRMLEESQVDEIIDIKPESPN